MRTKVALVRCKSYDFDLVYASVKRAIELLGGIKSFIPAGKKVLVKPNLLVAVDPERAITTHPHIVKAVIKILKEIDCEVYLGDSPSVWAKNQKVWDVYNKCGMVKLAQEENVELVDFEHPVWKKNFPMTKWLDFCDYFISLPKFKTHGFMTLTGAVKNTFGIVCGLYKAQLHKKYPDNRKLAAVLIDIYEIAKPHLTIIDGIVGLEGDGPTSGGIPKNTGFILAGSDGVAIDSILALIMGLKPLDILTNQEAKRRNLGVTELKDIEILGDDLSGFIDKNFKLPRTSIIRKIPTPILKIAKAMLKFYPKIEHSRCVRCAACVRICPAKAMSIKNKKVVINYSKCISCFCCQEVCLYSAIKIKKSILAKIVGL